MHFNPASLLAAERLSRLGAPFETSPWSRDELIAAGKEGKRRWEEAQELFGASWSMFGDAVSVVSPSFAMESHFSEVAERITINSYLNTRIAISFMKWARCPRTCSYPNPYEPWIEIWEHGCSFRVEHGQFVDLFDVEGSPCGAVVVTRV